MVPADGCTFPLLNVQMRKENLMSLEDALLALFINAGLVFSAVKVFLQYRREVKGKDSDPWLLR